MSNSDPPSYGILRQRTTNDDHDSHVEEIYYLGYTVIPSGLPADVLNDLRGNMDRYCQHQSEESGGPTAPAENGILRCPLSYDDSFLKVATLPPVLEVARRVLGQNIVLLQQNGIINEPNQPQYQSKWHRDLPYQHFVSTQKLAVNALLCIDDFTFDTGGTFVLPGSQMFEEFPSAGLVRRCERVVEATAGSVIMMDAMLYHRAGTNVSTAPRRGVNHVIGKPLLAQQIDIPRLIGPRFANDPFLSRYLGYHWNPAADVRSWRAKRFQAT